MATAEHVNQALRLPKDTPPGTWASWVPSSLALTSEAEWPVNGRGQLFVFISQAMVDFYTNAGWFPIRREKVLQRSLITAFGVKDITDAELLKWLNANQGNFGTGIRETIYVTGNTYEVAGNRVYPDAPAQFITPDIGHPLYYLTPDPIIKQGMPIFTTYYEDNVAITNSENETQISKGVALRGYRVERLDRGRDYEEIEVIFEPAQNSIDTNALDTQGGVGVYVQNSPVTLFKPLFTNQYQVLLQAHCSGYCQLVQLFQVRLFEYGKTTGKIKIGVYLPPNQVTIADPLLVDFVCILEQTVFCSGTFEVAPGHVLKL